MSIGMETAVVACALSFVFGKFFFEWRGRAEIEAIRNNAGQRIMSIMDVAQRQVDDQRDGIAYRAHLAWAEAAKTEETIGFDGKLYRVHEQYQDKENEQWNG